jgi:four helix bundle protein
MKIFEITKSFPKETYSLTDQIRRSSKCSSVTMAEAYRKEFTQNFYSKLTDSDGENFETQVWLNFCKYISEQFTMNLFH